MGPTIAVVEKCAFGLFYLQQQKNNMGNFLKFANG